jgi:hypothetical protein
MQFSLIVKFAAPFIHSAQSKLQGKSKAAMQPEQKETICFEHRKNFFAIGKKKICFTYDE